MVYLYLGLIWLSAFGRVYSPKRVSMMLRKDSDMFLTYGIRMLLCVVIGFILIAVAGEAQTLRITPTLNWISVLSGIVNAAFVAVWFYSVRYCAVVTISIALLLGSAIPIVTDIVFFNAEFSLFKTIGILLLAIAIWLLAGYDKKRTGKIGRKQIGLLVLNGALQGIIELCQQLYKHFGNPEIYSGSVFSFYTFVYGFLILAVCFVIFKEIERKKALREIPAGAPLVLPAEETMKGTLGRLSKVAIHIGIMALCLFLNQYCQTQATTVGGMPADALYSTIKGGNLIITTIFGAVFFKEKPTVRSLIGVLVAIIALLCINLLPGLVG